MTHTLPIRVYYGDTDAGGVVYYATYLRFTEMARTEFLRASGYDIHPHHHEGYYFVVRKVEAEYHAPARLGDLIGIETRVEALGGASMTLAHRIVRGGELLVEARVQLVHVDGTLRPRRLPEECRKAVERGMGADPGGGVGV
jgi:acyl-CoA thioester hydrolase